MAKPNLPVNVDATYGDDADPSVKIHQQHHDTVHTLVNLFDPVGSPASGWTWGWNAAAACFQMRAPTGGAGASGVVEASEHGIGASNGVDDDTAEWTAAIAAVPAGGTLRLAPGMRTKIGTTVTVNNKDLTIEGYGATVIQGTNNTAIVGSCTYPAPVNVTAITSVSTTEVSALTGFTSVLTLSATANLVQNDVVKIVSDDLIPDQRPGSGGIECRQGEFAVVRTVSANGLTVTLSGLLRESYATNVRLTRAPQNAVHIRGLTFETLEPDSATWTAGVVAFRRQVNPSVVDVTIKSSNGPCVSFNSCFGYRSENLRVSYAKSNSTTSNQLGYGILDASSSYGYISNLRAEYVRHAFTDGTGGTAAASTDLTNYGRSYNANIVDSVAVGTSTHAFDTHHAGDGHVFTNCSAYNSYSSYGFQLRGKNHRIVNPKVFNCLGGIVISEDVPGGLSHSCIIQDPDIRGCDSGIRVNLAPAGHPTAGTMRTTTAFTVLGTAVFRDTDVALALVNGIMELANPINTIGVNTPSTVSNSILRPVSGDLGLRGHIVTVQDTATGSSFTTGTSGASVAATANDVRGSFAFGTTAAPPGANVRAFRVIFNSPYPGTTPPVVHIQPSNAAAYGLGAYAVLVTGSGAYTAFDVYCTTAPAPSQAAGAYAFTYVAVG